MTDVTVPQHPQIPTPPLLSADGRYWWDGQLWQPLTGPGPQAAWMAAPSQSNALVILGYITAVLMPIAGFMLGIVAITRPDPRVSRQGAWIIGLAASVVFVSMVVIMSTGG